MDAPIHRKYDIYHGTINEVEFSNGRTNFCLMNQLKVGSLVAVRAEMREGHIGLFVAKIC
jgi:hypothetical protein